MIPLDMLVEYLKTFDELMLCELLDISSEDILDKFQQKVIERREYLERELELIEQPIDMERDQSSGLTGILSFKDIPDYNPDDWN